MAVRVTVLTMLVVAVAVVAGLPGARRGSLAAWAAAITGTLLQVFLWYSGALWKKIFPGYWAVMLMSAVHGCFRGVSVNYGEQTPL